MYTYAFFHSSTPPLNVLAGIAGEVQVVENGQLSALVEPDLEIEVLQTDDSQLVQAVLIHDRMICELFWQTTILPLRFGTCFVSQESLLEHLGTHQDSYLAKLARLEGKAEYRLKLTPCELPVSTPPDVKGKQYFLAKKQQYQDQQALQEQRQSQLEQVFRSISKAYPDYRVTEATEGVEKLYLLVDRQQETQLYQHLQAWQNQSSHWELMLGEALPPYHFV